MSCSRTKRSDAGEARTGNPLSLDKHSTTAFPYRLLYGLQVHLKGICSKQYGPRSDYSSKSTLIMVHIVHLLVKIRH